MKKLVHRYKRWKEWRELTWMNKFQQVMVLLGIKHCTHFEQFCSWRKED